MSRYVIRWHNGHSFSTLPVHAVETWLTEETFPSKGAAIASALNELCNIRSDLDEAIKAARKKLKSADRREELRAAMPRKIVVTQ